MYNNKLIVVVVGVKAWKKNYSTIKDSWICDWSGVVTALLALLANSKLLSVASVGSPVGIEQQLHVALISFDEIFLPGTSYIASRATLATGA